MNDKFKPGDRVYCIFNSSIEGEITQRDNHDGIYLYSLKVDDEESFIKHFALASVAVKFLHYQLRKV